MRLISKLHMVQFQVTTPVMWIDYIFLTQTKEICKYHEYLIEQIQRDMQAMKQHLI